MRRLLLIPALALVLVGTPVLALQDVAPPPVSVADVPVAPGETVTPGWQSADTPVDATLVGVTWEGDADAEFTIESQASDGTWSEATAIEGGSEADAGTQDEARAAALPANGSEPVWIGEDAIAVRVTLTGDTPATDVTVAAVDAQSAAVPEGAAGALGGVLGTVSGTGRWLYGAALAALVAFLVALALGWSPWRGRGRRWLALVGLGAFVLTACVPAAPPAPPAAQPSKGGGGGSSGGGGSGGSPSQPSIRSRSQWGARAFDCSSIDYADSIKLAAVHHTVNNNNYSSGQVDALVRGIQTYHIDTLGYCDIAYNFLIARGGQIYEGRAGGVTKPVIGAHAGGFNSGSTGVALIGDYSGSQPPSEQWSSLVRLLRWRLHRAGVDPSKGATVTAASSPCGCVKYSPGQTVTFANAIVAHRDLDYTSCPGDAFAPRMDQLRGEVQDAGL
jgi:hypothetical protein